LGCRRTGIERDKRKRSHGSQHAREDEAPDVGYRHHQRPHSMPSSLTAGAMVGDASAYWLTAHSPAFAAQVAAKVQGGVLALVMPTLPPVEVMIAVSPGWVSCTHWKLNVQTLAAPSCSTTTERPLWYRRS